jgi:hypothetical protein
MFLGADRLSYSLVLFILDVVTMAQWQLDKDDFWLLGAKTMHVHQLSPGLSEHRCHWNQHEMCCWHPASYACFA